MAKYSFEFKKKIVEDYLAGKGGCKYLAKKYNVPSYKNIKIWIKNYQTFGNDGLRRSRKQQNYPFEYKLHVIELYLTTEVSYQELALQEKIYNPSLITRWVNDFRIAGPDALRPKKRGRKTTMSQDYKSKKNDEKNVDFDASTEHVRELEDELLRLRIENAYLKELRRLRLEDEACQREQLESSTISEETSD